MKKTILIFLTGILCGGLSAQNFYYPSGSTQLDEAGLQGGSTTNLLDFLKDASGTPVTFSWRLHSADTIKQTTGATVNYGICDNVACYNSFVGTTYDMDPVSGPNNPANFKLQCFSASGELELRVKIRVWDQSSPGIEDTVSFIWRTNNFIGLEEEKLDNKIKMYPNPVSDVLYITNNIRATEVKVFDIVGNEVHFASIGPSGKVNFNHLPQGIYLVELRDGEKRLAMEKVVKR